MEEILKEIRGGKQMEKLKKEIREDWRQDLEELKKEINIRAGEHAHK
jgi:hypothetical protein